jgi:hypothetical protein
MSWRRAVASVAGPALIAGVVLLAMRGVVFGGMVSSGHPDLLAFWVPRWSFLGRSLASGHVPMWNPYEMLGVRYASDPQSGWLALLPMAAYSWLSPGGATRTVVTLQPLLAGLGLFGFLRVDGLGRVAATIGGLSLAAAVSASEISHAMAFAGAMAWTPVLLLGAAGFVHASRWSSRLAWTGVAALAWSQVATAHLSHGLAVATVITVAYLLAHLVAAARAGAVRVPSALARLALFGAVVAVCSLAILIPRLDFIASSSLGEGYDRLGAEVAEIAGDPQDAVMPGGVWAGWPWAASAAPGAYAGALVLIGVPAAFRARRHRATVVATGAVLAGTYVLLSPAVLGAAAARDALLSLPYGDVLLHNPGRLRYVAVIALPVLGAVGVQGLIEDPPTRRRLWALLVGGVALWVVVPLIAGGTPARWALFAVGGAAAVALLLLTRSAPRIAAVLPIVLAAELLAGVVLANRWSGDQVQLGLEGAARPLPFQPLRAPDVDLSAFLRPTDFVSLIANDRYLTWVPPEAAYEKGYLFSQAPTDWPALANGGGTLFGLKHVLGYNPLQPPRYWAYLRATDPLPLFYNAAALRRPREVDMDLLGVRYVIVPQRVVPTVDGTVVATADGYDLVRVRGAEPLVSAPTRVRVARSPVGAIRRAVRDRFDPSTTVILETDPGLATDGPPSPLTFEVGRERVEVRARLRSDSVVLVRMSYDPGWTATVDGTPADVLPADGFLMGVPVPAGDRVVELTYRDDALWRGLRASAIAWLTLFGAILVALAVEWRRASRGEPMPLPTPDA